MDRRIKGTHNSELNVPRKHKHILIHMSILCVVTVEMLLKDRDISVSIIMAPAVVIKMKPERKYLLKWCLPGKTKKCFSEAESV